MVVTRPISTTSALQSNWYASPGAKLSGTYAAAVAAAPISEPLQFLEHPHKRQPLATRLAIVRLQQPIQLGRPRPQIGDGWTLRS